MRTVPTIIATAAVTATLMGGAAGAAGIHPFEHGVVQHTVTTPCPTESTGVNCFWDARTRGNGHGHSFYVVSVGKRVAVIYTNRAYNRDHGRTYSH